MKSLPQRSKSAAFAAGLSLASALAGCGGGLAPVLGSPAFGRVPTVTSTAPAASVPFVTAVATNAAVTATFSQPMQPASINADTFTLPARQERRCSLSSRTTRRPTSPA